VFPQIARGSSATTFGVYLPDASQVGHHAQSRRRLCRKVISIWLTSSRSLNFCATALVRSKSPSWTYFIQRDSKITETQDCHPTILAYRSLITVVPKFESATLSRLCVFCVVWARDFGKWRLADDAVSWKRFRTRTGLTWRTRWWGYTGKEKRSSTARSKSEENCLKYKRSMHEAQGRWSRLLLSLWKREDLELSGGYLEMLADASSKFGVASERWMMEMKPANWLKV